MRFKEWILLNEMPHLAMPEDSSINGITGDWIDMRFEDWGRGLNPQKSGNIMSMKLKPPRSGNFKAKTKEGWLVYGAETPYSGPSSFGGVALKTDVQPVLHVTQQLSPQEQEYEELNPYWFRFVLITNGNKIVKEPEWPRDKSELVLTVQPPKI